MSVHSFLLGSGGETDWNRPLSLAMSVMVSEEKEGVATKRYVGRSTENGPGEN